MNHRRFALLCLFVLGVALLRPAFAAEEPAVSLTIDSNHVVGQIDERIYSHFLEHIYHSCNGGLWGEIVWNRSFEEARTRDPWFVRGGCIVSPEKIVKESHFVIGDGDWKDYACAVEVRRTSAKGDVLIGVRGDHGQLALALGDGPAGFQLVHTVNNRKQHKDETRVLTARKGKIETGRWYLVRILCEGPRINSWLDEVPLLDSADNHGPKNGPVSFGVGQARAEFRNLRVVSQDGRELFDGQPPSPARHWQTIGNGSISLDTDRPLNSLRSIKIVNSEGETGVEQHKYRILKGEVYRGSLWARGDAPAGIVVRFRDGEKTVWEKTLAAPQADWQEFPLEVAAATTAEYSNLQIVVRGKATVWLDQVSLMPDRSKATGGFRPDLLAAVQGLRPPVIRWPGGSFVGGYFWKHGIGPQHTRIGKNGWDELDPLSFGLDEFMALCRKVGSEPLIAINVGLDKPELVQDACDLIEYCNGPADSKWGRLRAENGHAEPYRVKYFEIGNETWGMGAENYAKVVRQFVPPMKKADPSIQIAACGSGGISPRGIGLEWNRIVIQQAADLFDYLSIHHYENPDNFATGPGKYEAFFRETGRLIATSKNPQAKLFVSEWNAQSTDWRTGLYCGGILNGFERSSDLVAMATPALFLRHVSAPAWDNAFINFDYLTWFPAPNYVVMKLYRDHYARDRLAVSGDAGPLNVMATQAVDGRRLVLKAVNPSDRAVPVRVKIHGRFQPRQWKLLLVAPDDLNARNTLDKQHIVHEVEASIDGQGNEVRFTLPRWSVGVAEATR